MKVELLKKDENSITLLIHDIFPEFTNTIRRYSFMVRGLAIDEIVVSENSSQIWDEYIAHRLGQIPLKYSPEDTNCDVITGSIKKEGPCIVTSSDIVIDDEKVKVLDEEIDICPLNEGERLICDLEIRPGVAHQHAKFQIGLVSCRPLYDLKGKQSKKLLEEIKKICPRKTIPGELECNGCKYCEENIKEVELIPTNSYILYVEGWSMDPKEYLLYIVNSLINELEDIKNQLK